MTNINRSLLTEGRGTMANFEEMKKIFLMCQESLQCHPQLLKNMETVYKKISLENFCALFVSLLKRPLAVSENHPTIERLFAFVSKFVTSFENKNDDLDDTCNLEGDDDEDDVETDPFFLYIFQFLLKIHNANSVAVRYRVCYLINKMLTDLGNKGSISGDLFESIREAMLDRMFDKQTMVRTQAAYALSWLQEPTDPECPVITAYLYHLSKDPQHAVRHAVLKSIAATSRTLGPIMERIRDVKDIVRKSAYTYLADNVTIRMLSISQRVKLLTQGLNDRSENVKKVVETKLLPVWLKHFNNNIEQFLLALDVQTSSEISTQALHILFNAQDPGKIVKEFNLIDNRRLIPEDQLSSENAFYWKVLCQYIKSKGGAVGEDGFDDLVPELTPFCEYVKKYVLHEEEELNIEKRLEHEFISLQLLTIIGEYDLADQAGRKNLHSLIRDLLFSKKVSLALVKPIIACFKKVQPHYQAFMQELVEIISEIRAPIIVVEKTLETDAVTSLNVKIAGVSVELNILREQLQNCISNQDFGEAQRLKLQISQLEEKRVELQDSLIPESQETCIENNDAQTLLKCLRISTEMLRVGVKKGISPGIQSLEETLLLPGIQNSDSIVRHEAVLALGLCSLRSAEIASKHLFLFLQICQLDREIIRVTALRAIFDIFLFFGLEAFQDGNSNSNSNLDLTETSDKDKAAEEAAAKAEQAAAKVMSILSTYLDSESSEIRTVVAENIGKMLFLGRVYSARLLSRLLLLWYNPITEQDTYLRHFIGVFILEYAASESINSSECLEEAFMLTLHTLFDAPPSSPLSRIDDWNVVHFYLSITSTAVCKQNKSLQESSIHDRLAVVVCNEILKNPNSPNVQLLTKILCNLEVTPHSTLADLLVLAEEISKVVKDRTSTRFVIKFITRLNQANSKISKDASILTSTTTTDEVSTTADATIPSGSTNGNLNSESGNLISENGNQPTVVQDEAMSDLQEQRPESDKDDSNVLSSLDSLSLNSPVSKRALLELPNGTHRSVSFSEAVRTPNLLVTSSGYTLRKRKYVGGNAPDTL